MHPISEYPISSTRITMKFGRTFPFTSFKQKQIGTNRRNKETKPFFTVSN
jgi:hypothetical protein